MIDAALGLYNNVLCLTNTMYGITHMMLSKNNNYKKWLTAAILLLILIQTPQITANPMTINRETLTITLEEDVTIQAQITTPAIGEGPFPIVLLVPGGGLTDMDEYIPASLTTNGESAAPMKQLAEYLSERGFIVLRYNKRGTQRNATMVDYELYSHATVDTFKADAEKALEALKKDPRADTEDITVIGHSESSIIVTRMALDDPSISKIVMMGAAARDYLDIKYTQIVEQRLEFADSVMDIDGDGLVSLDESVVSMEPYANGVLPRSSVLMDTGNGTSWIPTWDPDGDGNMSIENEFKPVLLQIYGILTNPNYQGYNQTEAHVSWGATMNIIGDLEASILVLQGEADYQTPLVEAKLLEQSLADSEHRDHTLYTYPGLSHYFHPSDEWQVAMGPFEGYVLNDLYQWLVSPDRSLKEMHSVDAENKKAVDELEQVMLESNRDLQNQIDETNNSGNDTVIPAMIVIFVVLVVAVVRKGGNKEAVGSYFFF